MFFTNTVDEQDQYHQTIRNLVVIIGSLFSKMILVRKNHKTNEIEDKKNVSDLFSRNYTLDSDKIYKYEIKFRLRAGYTKRLG